MTLRETIADDRGTAHAYTSDYLPAGVALELAPRLLEALSGAVSFERGVASACAGIAAVMMKQGMAKLALDLLQTTARDGVRLNNQAAFETAFTGNLGELVRVLAWVVEQNFAPFGKAAVQTAGERLRTLLTEPDASGQSWLAILMSSGPSGSASAPASGATSR